MTKLVVKYDQDTGEVRGWRYHPDDEYTPGEGELAPGDVDHREIEDGQFMVDTAADPPTLVEDPEYDPRTPAQQAMDRAEAVDKEASNLDQRLDTLMKATPVQRGKVSSASKDAYRTERGTVTDTSATTDERIAAIQAELDILFEIVTGEQP